MTGWSQFRRLLIGGCLQFGLMKVIFSRFVCFFTILKSALLISYARHWLIQVPDIVRSIEEKRVVALRQQSQLLCHMYFSSINRIIHTTLEVSICCHFIMISFLYWFETLFRLSSKGYNRICGRIGKDGRIWNSFPGGLVTLSHYCDSPSRLPWMNAALLQNQHYESNRFMSSNINSNFTSDLKDKFLIVYWIITILDYSYLG